MSAVISAAHFERRLVAMCARGALRGLPKKTLDWQIVLASVRLTLDPSRSYSEREINEAIQRWRAAVAPHFRLDHVIVRRNLIEEGLVSRDPAGRAYRAEPLGPQWEPAIAEIDPVALVEGERAAAAARRRNYLGE